MKRASKSSPRHSQHSRVRFAPMPTYSRPPNLEEYRCFIPFIDHVERCITCMNTLDTRYHRLCALGLHLSKKVLTLIYYSRGDLYSSGAWEVYGESVLLELDREMNDIRRLARLIEVRSIYLTHSSDSHR